MVNTDKQVHHQTNSNKQQFVNKMDNKKASIQCARCKLVGHLASNCRVNLKPKQEKIMTAVRIITAVEKPIELLKINGFVENIPAELYFDSGATASLISSKLAEENGIPITPSDIQIRSANNSVDEVKGITPLLTIKVADHLCKLRLLVFDLGEIDILLGLNWFKATGAGLYPAQKLLKFDDITIQLHSINKEEDDIEDVNVINTDEADLLPISFDIFSNKSDQITTQSILSNNEQTDFDKLKQFIEASNIFAYEYSDIEGSNLLPHVISTTSEKPIFIPRYRRSNYENEIISKEIDLMLKAKIIQPSNSPYSSSVVLVPKPDGSKRVCIDYRKLNAITVADNFPLPRIQDNLDSLSGSQYFTIFDLFSGYFQTFIEKQSIPKTAFTTANGHYEFLRTPFGLRNAPSQFSRLMQIIFGKYDFITLYLDDITVHSKSFSEHQLHVRKTI